MKIKRYMVTQDNRERKERMEGVLSCTFVTIRASHQQPPTPSKSNTIVINRRILSIGMGIVGVFGEQNSAEAAARRPPPSPKSEKMDPNLSGLQAKVMASKRRKEAMKQEIAKLRLKGNTSPQQQ